MATVTAGTPAEVVPPALGEIVLANSHQLGINYILAGAGGTGARVASILPKILKAGDGVIIADPDVVESRNLLRQHFLPGDVGRNKAERAATRMRASLPASIRDHVAIMVHEGQFQGLYETGVGGVSPMRLLHDESNRLGQEAQMGFQGRIVIALGCVDNASARRQIHSRHRRALDYGWMFYLDAGNLLRNGQVVLSFKNPVNLLGNNNYFNKSGAGACYSLMPKGHAYEGMVALDQHMEFDGITELAPALLKDDNDGTETDNCAVRIDTQTVAANATAATIMVSMLSSLIDGLPFSTPMVDFSTNPFMASAVPFPNPRPINDYNGNLVFWGGRR